MKNRAEVIMNFIYEYNEERHISNEKALAKEEGKKEIIEILIEDNLDEGIAPNRIIEKLEKRYKLSEEDARKYVEDQIEARKEKTQA